MVVQAYDSAILASGARQQLVPSLLRGRLLLAEAKEYILHTIGTLLLQRVVDMPVVEVIIIFLANSSGNILSKYQTRVWVVASTILLTNRWLLSRVRDKNTFL
jgi:hypothetical protein